MASSQSELGALRAEARRLHRAVTRKISRNRTKRGAEIGNTKFDPRRDASKIKHYNRRQLQAYIANLERFVSRKTQFVPDSQYRPIPVQKWREYKAAEKTLNQKMRERFDKFGDRMLPEGITVRQRLAMTEPIHPQMHNPASNAGIRAIERKSKSVRSLEALNKLIIETKKRADPRDAARIEKANRTSVNAMLDVIGRDDWRERISLLTSAQFDLLWNMSGSFANAVSLYYEVSRKLLEGKDAATRWMETVTNNAISDIEKMLAWIEKEK